MNSENWHRLELYRFSYFDSMRGKWMRARYVATLENIRATYGDGYRIEGEPEVREGPRDPRILGR